MYLDLSVTKRCFMLCKVGEALFRAVQRRLDSHHWVHELQA